MTHDHEARKNKTNESKNEPTDQFTSNDFYSSSESLLYDETGKRRRFSINVGKSATNRAK